MRLFRKRGVIGRMPNSMTQYVRTDLEYNAWRCKQCGYTTTFEADGPTENGWDFCPHCRRAIILQTSTGEEV